jgi:hypothetical protein
MVGVLGAPGNPMIIHDIVGREYLQSAVRKNLAKPNSVYPLAVFN